ncbi:pyridoxal phosphate-dependent aminotransferase [Pseudooceanicola sp.]|uniref:pyridoxal phosphate-dependent aminotransferase n=1 Tax=Pseudooceanicola sp. TaxID=1914328 RepID=UPI0026061D89|nr:pyridoxal phosphate-dependent aminotransferase [Pseudooceanicola sp.]MDF1856241.1 pyridoxal phosphate-dependent aminotransferase [Pseudooceanicola sp.]
MNTPNLTPLVAGLPATVPFVGPEELQRNRGAPFAARLGANENVFGPSPRAIAALQAENARIWQYGDAGSHDLRNALAAELGCGIGNIVVGEGIDGLLGYLVRMLVAPGDAVVTSAGAYPTFNYHVAGYGGRLETVPYRDDAEDLVALIARAAEVGARLIYFANPDNPMGSYLPGVEVAAALQALPEGALLILDEAYLEFAPDDAAVPLPLDDPRLIRMRTFSKAYGMAGARVGYAIGAPGLIAAFDRVRNHFGMNRAAQAGALAALADRDWLARTKAKVAASRDEIGRIAAENGLKALPSATNFVTVDCGGDGNLARRVVAELGDRGVFIRMPFVAPQDRCVRISCGTEADMALLASTLPAALTAARAAAARAG